MTLSEDPWRSLAKPREETAITARRVSDEVPWNFFWAIDREGAVILLLRYAAAASPTGRCPKLRGVDVTLLTPTDPSGPGMLLRLKEASLRDLFAKLCVDIIACASAGETEAEAAATALARTWRWHHLLRGASTGLLSPEEQKGLLGELLVLEEYMLRHLPASVAIAAWRGPLGESKDFLLPWLGVESKAMTSTSAQAVRISSEYQLDDQDAGALFLHLSNVEQPTDDSDSGQSLNETVEKVRNIVVRKDDSVVGQFDALLLAAGYRPQDDYSAFKWNASVRGIYRVGEDFPRITSSGIPAGVSGVQYTLSIPECASFLVSAEDLTSALRQGLA